MKNTLMWCALLSGAHCTLFPQRELVDKIVLRVNGVNVTQSQLALPQITKNGQPFTPDEYINQELWVQRAVRRHMTPSDEDVERSVVAFKDDNGFSSLSKEEADARLQAELGLTFAQYRAELKRHYAAQECQQMELRNRSSVSEIEVRTYHAQNPSIVPAEYLMRIATLTPAQEREWQKNMHAMESSIAWETFDWFKHDDIAHHLRAVYELKKGLCSQPISFNGQFLVVKLIDKRDAHQQSLEERYADIERRLQRQKLEKFAREVEVQLRKDAVISYL